MEQLPYHEPRWMTQTVKPRTLPSAGSPVVERWQQITRGTKAEMLAQVAGTTAEGAIVMARARDDLLGGAPLELGHRILPTGEAVADIGGELDIATAEMAVRYIKQVIDSHRGPVIVQLTAVRFCDAQGLSALLRMARYAQQAGRPFRLDSPSRSVTRIMRMTGLDHGFPG
jgi:anti-anti-sigma factor